MQVIFGKDSIPADFKGACVTLGVFDGLHRAHQQIINRMLYIAHQKKCHSMVVTFDPHPRQVLNHAHPLPILTVPDEKVALLSRMGVDFVLIIDVNQQFLQTSEEEFITDLLVRRLKVCQVVVGFDYHFGHDRRGTAASLNSAGQRYGFQVEIVPPFSVNGQVVSSSLLRRLIEEGQVNRAAEYLGRPYHLTGRVVRGAGRGRQIGFPTANLAVERPEKLIPADGVYLARAELDGQTQYGLVNIGVRKTFREQERTIELHLFNYPDRDLYTTRITIEILEKLRDEIRFATVIELQHQMQKDCAQALTIIKNYKS